MTGTSNSISYNKIDQLMKKELKDGTYPGAVLGILHNGEIVYKNAFGYARLGGKKRSMRIDTLFDLASLTKVIATTTSIMQLIESGVINLWDYLSEYFPELPEDKAEITIFNLLTHSSGFQAIVELWEKDINEKEKIEYILQLPLKYKTGNKVLYSDPNYILLGELIERVTGNSLDTYTRENIFRPLGMSYTGFNPLKREGNNIDKENIAATEWCGWRERMIVGEVHDENCASFNGVSGHAGLFSNLHDLFIFVKMLLNKGRYYDIRVLHSRTISLMIRNWTEGLPSQRALGWDLITNFRSSGGVLLSPNSYGHTGFTGTSIWIDPLSNVGVILLTNRVHPSRENQKIISLRPRLHNLIASTIL